MRRKLQTRRGRPTLRVAHGDGGAGLRADQAGPGLPAVPDAGLGKGQRRMVADLHRPQPAQAVPLRPTGPRMSMDHPANRGPGMDIPPVGHDFPCPEPPRASIVNRQESLTPIAACPERLVSQYSDSLLVLQRLFKEGGRWRRDRRRRGAWHGSVWPVRYYPAYPPAIATTQPARTVPGAASHAPPGRPAVS